MDYKFLNEIKMHVAGAIVRHSNPFKNLPSHRNDEELSQEFIDTWYNDFCDVPDVEEGRILHFAIAKQEITDEIILKLLGDFNWRTRQVGAYFAAVTEKRQMIDIIGVHLLKSEVCFAGKVYSLILAHFNTKESVEYLNLYLDYYLQRKDLYFDQREAMEAVKYLDQQNGTNDFERHYPQWLKFISDKQPYWDKKIELDRLEKQLQAIDEIIKI